MNTLATLALVFTPVSAVSNAPVAVGVDSLYSTTQPTDGSLLDQVMERYNSGTDPEFTSMIGWWTGRCYLNTSPSSPFGVLMVAAETSESVGDDNGPQFPPKVTLTKRMALVGHIYNSPAFFDEMTEEKKQSIRDFETSGEFKNLVATSIDGSWNTDNVDGNLRYTLRKNGDYFYGPATLLKDSGENKAGSVFAACYFFKKVN
jgi:hypothetical protein